MERSFGSASKAISNIKRYHKRYGLAIGIKASLHYFMRFVKKGALKNRVPEGAETVLRVNGYDMEIIPKDSGISSELMFFRTHEPVTTTLTQSILEEGMTCLDIGSNIGYYALLERKRVGKDGKIIAIEPSPNNFEFLKRNVERNGFDNIFVYNFAATDKDGETKFLVYHESNGCMTIPSDADSQFPGKIINVPAKRIDSFVNELGVDHIDFIRMDVEGYEYHIFQGMKDTLQKFRPLIQIELHVNLMGKTNTWNLLKFLKDVGYFVKFYIPRDLDVPFIGSMKNVEEYYDMDNLLYSIENDKKIPSFIMLILMNNGKDRKLQDRAKGSIKANV